MSRWCGRVAARFLDWLMTPTLRVSEVALMERLVAPVAVESRTVVAHLKNNAAPVGTLCKRCFREIVPMYPAVVLIENHNPVEWYHEKGDVACVPLPSVV